MSTGYCGSVISSWRRISEASLIMLFYPERSMQLIRDHKYDDCRISKALIVFKVHTVNIEFLAFCASSIYDIVKWEW